MSLCGFKASAKTADLVQVALIWFSRSARRNSMLFEKMLREKV